MAAAVIPEAAGVIGGVAGLFGGPDKNKIRDQQEQQNYTAAQGGSVSAAQTIYDNQKPGSGQTHERIVDDQKYWGLLTQAGWTVDGSGRVQPPSRTNVGPTSYGNPATLGGGGAVGNYNVAGPAPAPNPFLTSGAGGFSPGAIGLPSGATGELILFGVAALVTVLLVMAVRK